MVQPKNPIAILLFARSAFAERKAKGLPGGIRLHQMLLAHTQQTIQASGLPCYTFSEKEQHGPDFGSRLFHAMQSVFLQGVQKLIVLGADTPQLKPSHIGLAIQALDRGEQSLGPSEDGGFYLWGLDHQQFQQINFNKLPWQQGQLLEDLSVQIKHNQAQITFLEPLGDLDRTSDFTLLGKRQGVPLGLHLFLRMVLANLDKCFKILSQKYIPKVFVNVYYNKGSPLTLA
ncbi:TIGR04282 family arsenosugar biosynthesis glycosyltransferase [Sediminicola luteus]|uniref:DUF2064 domain-containing protein n=1 Tax=Sediminicola luteus TaxID=319238 RepID=A0A2A4GCM9_9FLAO|nr:DUF2064 domain-containing protein [Sediminicola luteus]PCE66367.1 hypothetical protein B7P33_03465 [Sediminicola luteus]